MKIALVHDFLNQLGGAERILESLHELFPEAPIYTLIYDPDNGKLPGYYRDWDIRPSKTVTRLPFYKKHYKKYIWVYPLAVEHFDLSDYDLVFSCSYLWSKGVITGVDTCHIAYIQTPMRQAWDKYHEYLRRENEPYFLRKFIPYLMHRIRIWDRVSTDRVDYILCNSRNVAQRIHKHYRREADIIHPPVNTSLYSVSDTIDDYFLCVSRLVPYKRIDIAIEAFNILQLPLKIIGEGNDYNNLKRMAKSNIEFLGWLSDREIAEFYSRCRAFVFPGEEDFGITPLEAQSAGRPVIAYAKGGALETVIGLNIMKSPEGKAPTGYFFSEPTAESLVDAVKHFNEDDFDSYKIREHALRFDKEIFKDNIRDYINQKYEMYRLNGAPFPGK